MTGFGSWPRRYPNLLAELRVGHGRVLLCARRSASPTAGLGLAFGSVSCRELRGRQRTADEVVELHYEQPSIISSAEAGLEDLMVDVDSAGAVEAAGAALGSPGACVSARECT